VHFARADVIGCGPTTTASQHSPSLGELPVEGSRSDNIARTGLGATVDAREIAPCTIRASHPGTVLEPGVLRAPPREVPLRR
jgi:hypothetical protein